MVLFTMVFLPNLAWADYTYGGQSLTFYYTGDSGPNYYYSGSGDNQVTEWNVTADALYQSSSSLYSGFSYVKLTNVNPLSGPLTGFTLAGSINNNNPQASYNNNVNLKVYRLATLSATERTLIGSITIGGSDVPSYTYIAEDGVSQSFNNEYIQLAIERSSSETTPTFTTGQITNITLTFSGTDYGISVGNYRVTSNNATDIFGDGNASFTAASGDTPATLTLNGVTIGTSIVNSSIISNLGNEQLTINLVGTNKLYGFINDASNAGTLKFTGTGSLDISNDGDVVSNFDNVTIDDGLYIQSNEPGVHWDSYNSRFAAQGSGLYVLTITPDVYYPIWVVSSNGVDYIQVSGTNKNHVLGENNTTVKYENDQLILDGFVCSTTEGEPAIVLGNQEEFKIYLSGDNTISSGGTGDGVYFNREVAFLTVSTDKNDPGTLTLGQPSSGNYSLTNVPYDCVIYENGLGFYNNTVSTVWPRLVIGGTQIMGTTDNVTGYENVSFDAGTNTLMLSGATIENATNEPDIDVYVKDLIVAISGANTVNGRFYGHYSLNGDNVGTIHFTKAEGATSPSITISGDTGDSGPVYEFSQCTWDNDLYLTEAKTAGGANVPGVYYGSSRFTNGNTVPKTVKISTEPSGVMLWIGETAVTSDNAANVFSDDDVLDGKVSVTFGDENKLILDASETPITEALSDMPIVSALPNLTISFKGSSSLNRIVSTNSAATLTFELAEGANESESSCSLSSSGETPWQGFSGNPVFNDKLVYLPNGDSRIIQKLMPPSFSMDDGLNFSRIDDGYGTYFDCYYSIDYEEGDDVGTTKYDSENPVTIETACTVTAHVEFTDVFGNTTVSDNVVGKYFEVADKVIGLTSETQGADLLASTFEVSPAIAQSDGITLSIVGTGNADVISCSEGKGTINGIGRCYVQIDANIAQTCPFEVLNNGDFFDVVYVDVVPPAPEISLSDENPVPNTAKVKITKVGTFNNATIKYKWGDGDSQTYNPEGTANYEGIDVQEGKLTAWVEVPYTDGNNQQQTAVGITAEATYTVKEDPGLSFTYIWQRLPMGETFSQEAKCTKITNPTLTWSSSDVNVATVDENGVVTPVSPSSTDIEITASFAGDDTYAPVSASYAVRVVKGTQYLFIQYKGESTTLARVKVTKGNSINIKTDYDLVCPEELVSSLTWTPDNSSVVTADNGVVTGLGCGSTRIVVKFAGNDNYEADTYEFYVDVAPPVPTINLAEGTYLSTHEPITITKADIANTAISYTWDDITGDNDATWKNYTDEGVALQTGTLYARVGYTPGDYGDVIYSDTVSVAYIVLVDPELTYKQGETAVTTATWTLGKENNTALPVLQNTHSVAVTYESDNTAVATVANDGTVTAVGIGTATITATSTETDVYAAGEASYTLTVNRQLNVSFSASNEWATYYDTENLATPTGLKAYQVTAVEGATVTISAIGYIPANTAVLLQNVSNHNTWSNIAASAYTGATSTFPNNMLKGSTEEISVSSITGGTVYVLYNNMFKRATSGTIPANRGYLVVSGAAAARLNIVHGGDDTGINNIRLDETDDSWYAIDGRKLNGQPQRAGFYIRNGKKVYIKK